MYKNISERTMTTSCVFFSLVSSRKWRELVGRETEIRSHAMRQSELIPASQPSVETEHHLRREINPIPFGNRTS